MLAIIPARGGSKGLPRKNALPLGGKPLVAWSIDAAKQAMCIERIVVTTDDEEIAGIARTFGAEVVMRPHELANDTASTLDAVRHCLLELSFDTQSDALLVLLQPTSPLRQPSRIDEAYTMIQSRPDIRSVYGVTEQYGHHPLKALLRRTDGTIGPIRTAAELSMPRQKLPEAYIQNGAIYALSVATLLSHERFFVEPCLPLIMTTRESIDIDSADDLKAAEAFLAAST